MTRFLLTYILPEMLIQQRAYKAYLKKNSPSNVQKNIQQ